MVSAHRVKRQYSALSTQCLSQKNFERCYHNRGFESKVLFRPGLAWILHLDMVSPPMSVHVMAQPHHLPQRWICCGWWVDTKAVRPAHWTVGRTFRPNYSLPWKAWPYRWRRGNLYYEWVDFKFEMMQLLHYRTALNILYSPEGQSIQNLANLIIDCF